MSADKGWLLLFAGNEIGWFRRHVLWTFQRASKAAGKSRVVVVDEFYREARRVFS